MTTWRWAVMENQQWRHPGNLESLPLSGTQSIFRWKFNPIYLCLIIHKKDPWFFITQDLFYLLPYHHLEFPLSLKKLIIIDVDLEFSVDMLRLYKWVLNSFQTLQKLINKLCSKSINNLFNFQALWQVCSEWGSFLRGHPVPILLWILQRAQVSIEIRTNSTRSFCTGKVILTAL